MRPLSSKSGSPSTRFASRPSCGIELFLVMETRNTISSSGQSFSIGRTLVSFGVAGLMTGLLLLTSESRPAHGEAVSSQPAIKAPEKSAPLPGLAKRITLDLRQMDILAVLKFLSEQGDFNVVPGKNVGGRVTLAVKDITIQDAFDIIALTNELAYVVQNRVVHVMTEADYQRLFGAAFADQRELKTLYLQHADATTVATVLGNMKSTVGRVVADPQTRTVILIDVPDKLGQMVAAAEGMDRVAELQTQAFELRYAKAADVKPEVEKALTPKLGAVRLDKRTNTLVVTDLVSQMQDIRRVISAFDRKTREVVIQARIMEVRLDDRLQVGVDWEALFKTVVDVRVTQFFPIVPSPVASGKLTVGTFSSDKFRVVLELLQSVGKTNILVIAGLMKDEKVGTEKRLPLLGEVPILGALFRSRDDRVAKTELIFFLTPTIISGGESVGVTGLGLRKGEGQKEEPDKEETDE